MTEDAEAVRLLEEIAGAARFVRVVEAELNRLYQAQQERYMRARERGLIVPRIAAAAGVSDAAIHHGLRKYEQRASA